MFSLSQFDVYNIYSTQLGNFITFIGSFTISYPGSGEFFYKYKHDNCTCHNKVVNAVTRIVKKLIFFRYFPYTDVGSVVLGNARKHLVHVRCVKHDVS